ncbi:MAG: PP2C family protein-serine/threonine phosphatase [Phycisphaerales bacterium]
MSHPIFEPAIAVVRSDQLDADRCERAVARILDAWPDHLRAPTTKHAIVSELLDEPKQTIGGADVVLVVLGAAEPSGNVYRLADVLGTVLCPALVLYDSEADGIVPAETDGLLVEPVSADAGYLASALSAIARRQAVVRRLSGEVRLMQASLGGVQGQVNRWQDEMQLAASVQQEFLPKKLPEGTGLDVGVVFRPAGYVSGDIYDVVQIDEHRTSFFIADAVGHGVPAALLTLVISRAFKTTEGVGADRRVLTPTETLEILNYEMTERLTDRSRFATAVCGVFDSRTNSVQLAGAGHPPPILSRGGVVERVETEGPLLGVFPEAEFPMVEFTMGPGDVLVIFSDGFETAFPDPSQTRDDVRLPTLTYLEKLHIASSGKTGLHDAVRALEADLDAQAGSLHQADDVTALFVGPSARASEATTTGSVSQAA